MKILKDKNGIEISEGDRVRLTDGETTFESTIIKVNDVLLIKTLGDIKFADGVYLKNWNNMCEIIEQNIGD